jgi:NTP pyrophosphatase (non-canonical NTP hydrolase)
MDFRTYQKQALKTDQVPSVYDRGVIVPMLGLAGEAGELLSEYKKHLRDGAAHRLFKERVAEELGDLLWYISNVASKFELDLDLVAQSNLEKCQDRWGNKRVKSISDSFDGEFPEAERFPRRFDVQVTNVIDGGSVKMKAFINGEQIGDYLTDNAYSDDGYRFHDVFHFGYAAVLGWSPVTRRNLKCKRKSNPIVDEVEDGGRATVIEEAISALAFDYAKKHNFLDGVSALDYLLLKTIKSITSHLEVSQRTTADWEKAILMGYEVWRQVEKNLGGKITIDLDERSIAYEES